MKQHLLEELSPYYDLFQSAATEGLRRMSKSQLNGVFDYRHLQRTHILNAFMEHLPTRLGSFEKCSDSYSYDRLVYHSDELNADLIFRRRGGVGMYAKQRLEERERQVTAYEQQLAMFDVTPRPFRADMPTQIALVWDLPPLDDNHKALEPFPLWIKIAKPGYKLDEHHWDQSFQLLEVSETYPKIAELNPEELDWDIESDDEAQEA